MGDVLAPLKNHARLHRLGIGAERKGEMRTALAAIREARGNLELLAKIFVEIQAGQAQPRESEFSPEWVEFYLKRIKPLSDDELQGLRDSLSKQIEALKAESPEPPEVSADTR